MRFELTAAALVVTTFLSACAATQTGVASGDRSQYATVAVIPRVTDRLLSAHWDNALTSPTTSEARMGWNAADGTGRIAVELLAEAGARATITPAATSDAARATDIAVVLTQTSLNALAETYNPGQDIFLSGVSVAGALAMGGLATIRVRGEGGFKPRSILHLKREASLRSNPDFCAVGITPSLVDTTTGETIRTGRPLMGVEKIPMTLSGTSWETFTPAERANVLAYCQSALRRVVSQSLVELDVVG